MIATKVHGRMRPGPNGAGLSRKAILAEIDASLRRLGTDYVDLYQIHRWDYDTPIEETLEALHDVVKAGKARYIGASSMYAWQFAKALHVAERHGWTRFVAMQNHLNLLYREEEREMLPLCRGRGHRRDPVEPARARPPDARLGRATSARAETDEFGRTLYAETAEADRKVVEALGAVAAAPRRAARAGGARLAAAAKPGVTAPIVGATKAASISTTPSPRSASSCSAGRDRRARGSRTCRTRWSAFPERRGGAQRAAVRQSRARSFDRRLSPAARRLRPSSGSRRPAGRRASRGGRPRRSHGATGAPRPGRPRARSHRRA